jgi:hypothetical protein
MSDFDEFKSYYALGDRLIETMSPEQVADCLRMLALNLADYRFRFGDIPRQDVLDLLGATEITDDQARLLRDGMELLVGYLATVREGLKDDDSPVH